MKKRGFPRFLVFFDDDFGHSRNFIDQQGFDAEFDRAVDGAASDAGSEYPNNDSSILFHAYEFDIPAIPLKVWSYFFKNVDDLFF